MVDEMTPAMNATAKTLFSLLFVALAILIGTQTLDRQGAAYTDATLKRALLTYGVARGLNGVISVAQGTEIAVQPAGLGMTFTPGEILDPLNDLVERFSWVMLMSSASAGLQKTLLAISAWPLFSMFSVAASLIAAAAVWLPGGKFFMLRAVAVKLALLILMARLSVPLMAIGSEWIYQQFLSSQYAEATTQLQNTADNLSRINQNPTTTPPTTEDLSLWGSAKLLYHSAAESVDIEARLSAYKEAAADATEYLINLIVVFVFQTIVLPLAFLGVIYAAIKVMLKYKLPSG